MAIDNNIDQMDDDDYEIYQELSNDLIKANEFFSNGDYQIAINLATNVVQQAAVSSFEKIEASAQSLIYEVKNVIQQKTDEALRLIDEALKQDDPERARGIYSDAIQYDSENIELKTIGKEIDRKFEDLEWKKKVRIIETRLKSREDFSELRETIHTAETMHPDETFPPELLALYKESRAFYENLASKFKTITTTVVGRGKLKERAIAVKNVRDKMLEGLDTWYDDKDSARDIPIMEAFSSFRESLNETFLSNLNDEHEQIQKDFLPDQPEAALERLDDRFSMFNEDEYSTLIDDKYLAQLQKIRSQVESVLEAKNRALNILAKADREGTTPIERLRYAVNAKEDFKYLQGVEEKIQRYKHNAAEDIKTEVKNCLDRAQIYIDQNSPESFVFAQEQIEEAEEAIKSWFLPEIPDEIGSARDECNGLRTTLLQHKNDYSRVIKKIEEIKTKLEDSQKLQSALEDYEELKSDVELSKFSEIKSFEKELIRKKEKGSLQLDAERAYREKDWNLLAKTCEELLTKEIEPEEREKIEKYYREAQAEILVISVQNAVRLGDIPTAQKGLNQITKLNPETESRLRIEKEIIEKCVASNEDYAQFFRKAKDLSARADLESKLKALNIYRFLKGSFFIADEEFPPYSLNFYTQQAEERTNQLSDEIRNEYLLPIIRFVDSAPGFEKRHFNEARKCAHNGRLLKKNHLLTDETHKSKIFEAQKFFAELQKASADEVPDPDPLLREWAQLKEDYPGNMDIEGQYIEVLIEVTQKKVQNLIASNNLQEAIDLILSTRQQPGLAKDMTLPFLLVDLLINNHDYDAAQIELRGIPDNSKYSQRIKELTNKLIQQKELNSWIKDLDEYVEHEKFVDALILLNSMMDNQDLRGNSLITLKQQEISQKGKNYYSRLAQPGLNSGASYTEKVESVKYLIELGKFEDLINMPKSKRQSIRNLTNLSEELIEVLPEMLNDLGEEVIDNLLEKDVENSLQEKRLRINSLIFICETLTARRGGSESVRNKILNFKKTLFEAREQNSKSLLSLEKIKPLLEQASQNQVWETAWRTGNWDELFGIRAQINESGFESLSDVKRFRERLDQEQKLYDFLSRKAQEIISHFNNEDYGKVRDTFRDIKVLPMNIFPSTSSSFFDQAHFELRKKWLDDKLYTADYWGDYHGWDKFNDVSLKRSEEIENWETWLKKVLDKKGPLDRDFNALERNENFENKNFRYEAWNDIQTRYEELEKDIAESEGNEVESNRSEEIQKQAQNLAIDVCARIADIKKIKGEKPSFPSVEKYHEALRFLKNKEDRALKYFIEEAERIGPSTDQEIDRLENARKTYATYLDEKQNGSLSKRLAKIFGKG